MIRLLWCLYSEKNNSLVNTWLDDTRFHNSNLLGVRRLVGALAAGALAAASRLVRIRSRQAATNQSADKAAHSKELTLFSDSGLRCRFGEFAGEGIFDARSLQFQSPMRKVFRVVATITMSLEHQKIIRRRTPTA